MGKRSDKFLVVIEIFMFWVIASLLLNNACLPNPIISLEACFEILSKGILTVHILASMKRILLGTFFGLLFAIPVGLLLGYSKNIDRYLGGLFNFLYTIPKVVFLPIIIVLLGIGDLPKIFLIALVLFFQQAVVIRDAANSIPRELEQSIAVWGATRWQAIWNLVIPNCLPDIMTSLRATLGTSIALLFITENFASVSGLGYYITNCMDRRNYEQMYAAIMVLAILGSLMYSGIGVLERRVCKWKFLEGKNS